MSRSKTLLLAAALALPPGIAAAQPAGALGQVQAHLRAVSSLTANFAQTDRRGQTLTGSLLLKRPGHIRFEYQKGVPLLIVGDGKAINVVDYQVKRVQRWPIGNSPLSVLLDPSQDISRIAKVIRDDAVGIAVQARDPKRPEFGTITLYFSRGGGPGGLTLHGWRILDSQNNTTEIRLSNQRFNVAVADSSFRFQDPRGRGPKG